MERTLTREGLRIDCRHRLRLTPADTRVLWPEYTDDGHVLARAFLDRYLCGGDSEVLMLRGPGAFEAARRVKRAIRSRHALGMFANIVHTAETPAELTRQGTHLGGRCAACAGPFPASGEAILPAVRPAGADFRAGVDIDALVDAMWPLMQADLAPPPPFTLDSTGTGNGDGTLWMAAYRGHSLDSAVTAVWRALPGIDLAHALLLTLFVNKAGTYPIARGSRDALARSRTLLLEHDIPADVTF